MFLQSLGIVISAQYSECQSEEIRLSAVNTWSNYDSLAVLPTSQPYIAGHRVT
jgi:hypothetical protein